MADDNYFVGIDSPTALRRELLEGSRDTLKLMQKYYDIMELRRHKSDMVHKLENQVKEIIILYNKMSDYLPEKSVISKKTTAVIDKQKMPKKPKEAKAPKPQPVVKQKELTKLERLESALSAIENKLNTLG